MLFLLSILIRFVWTKPNLSACSMWLHRPYEQRKKRIYKLEILQPFTAEQRIPLKEGYQVVYNLEMIFALAFQINTYPAQQLREYIISRLFQSEKSMVICMVNGNHKSYLKC